MNKKQQLKAKIAELTRNKFETPIGSSTNIHPRGVVLEHEDDEPQESYSFEIRNSEVVDVWDPDTNLALIFEGKVIIETNLDPVLLTEVFSIPSKSSTTIDNLIQIFGYPITAVEAVLFAAFVNYINQFSLIGEPELNDWRRLAFHTKIERGLNLLEGPLNQFVLDSQGRIQGIREDWDIVNQHRRKIHDQFAGFLENGTQS